MHTKLKNNKGFTIVETLIVLAIAATILVVVLLAVPALQANQKNTTLKTAANSLSAGVSSWSSNNNGSLPNCASLTGNSVSLGTLSGSNCATSGSSIALPGQITAVTPVTTAPSGASTNTLYYAAYQCSDSKTMAFSGTAGFEVAYYASGAANLTCITAG